MNKLFVLLFMGIFLISLASAFNFDNVKSYDEETKTVTIENAFGIPLIGSKVIEATLNTPQFFQVPVGKDQKVAQITCLAKDVENCLPKDFKLIYTRTGEEIQREIRIKYLTYESFETEEYSPIYLPNGTIKNYIVNGSHLQEREVWKDWDKDVQVGDEVIIGLFTDVQPNDRIEWIPTIAGVEIPEWAVWDSSYEVGLVNWYDWEGNSFVDNRSKNNGSNFGTTNITGKRGSGRFFNGTTMINISLPTTYTDSYSYTWDGKVNQTNSTGDGDVLFVKATDGSELEWLAILGDEVKFTYDGHFDGQSNFVTTNANLSAQNYYHITVNGSGNGTNVFIWVNGTNQTMTRTDGGSRPNGTVNYFFIGGDNATLMKFTWGSLDGFHIHNRTLNTDEVNMTYNNNFSCVYQFCNASGTSVLVHLISPINGKNLTATTNFFIANVTPNNDSQISIANVSILINGSINSTNTSGIKGHYNFSIPLGDGFYNWTVIAYGNDSTRYNATNGTFTFTQAPLFESNYTYDPNVTESSSSTFSGRFFIRLPLNSAYLQYNNTNYSTSINSVGGDEYILSSTITSPAVVTDTNISWLFWVNGINATRFNQTVFNINLDNCSTYTNYIVTYYLLDESQQTLINNSNSSIETTISLKTITGESVVGINRTFTGNSTPSICSQINLTSSGLRFWEQSRYGSTNYVYEQHNIQNQSMTSLPTNISLLDLLSTEATTFRITYKSSTFLPVPEAVMNIQRKYLGEGVFKSVESPITDANGKSSASFDLNAVLYKIIVTRNGTTLATFENPAIACDNILTGDCSINLNERQTVNQINTIDVENDFSYGLTQDNRTISLVFEIPSGTARTITLLVNQSTILGNSTACNQTTLASMGQVDCVIGSSLGDVFATSTIYIDGQFFARGSSQILDDRSQYFGTDNIILTFFLVLSIILLTISDPIALLFGIVIGLIASSLMLLLNSGSLFGGASVLMYVIIVIIILAVKIAMRNR